MDCKRRTFGLAVKRRSQIARLVPVEDGLGDVRGEIAEADEPREIGWAHALAVGECRKRHTVAADECGVEPARSEFGPVGVRSCHLQIGYQDLTSGLWAEQYRHDQTDASDRGSY